MQKDYLKRNHPAQQNATESAEASVRHSYLPRRSGTGGSGSIKDNSGADVSGDRVILYIHGKCYLKRGCDYSLTSQAVHTSSRHLTLIAIRSSAMHVKPVLEHSPQPIA